MAIGAAAPAPSPCTTRKTISAVMVGANPASTDPARKRPTPVRMTGLRPMVSASLE